MCISFWVSLSQPPYPLWPLVTLTNCLAGASPIIVPILIVYRSLLCYVTFFFQLYHVFQKQTQKFSIFFGFPFPAEMLTTKDSLSTALTSTIKTSDWPHLDRVSFGKTGIPSMSIWIATTFSPGSLIPFFLWFDFWIFLWFQQTVKNDE
jgi:hypothetical protein